MLRQYRLRVELHALDVVLAMPQAHNGFLFTLLILCPSRYLKAIRQCRGIYDEAVVARRRKRAR